MKPDRGVWVLLLGLGGVMSCGIFGVIAWIMGNADLAEMRAGTMDPAGEQLTRIGRMLGIAFVVFNLGVVLIVLVGGVFVTFFNQAAVH